MLSDKELMLSNCGAGEDSRRSNQSVLKEINPEYSLEKTWIWGSLRAGGEGGNRR